MVFCLAGNPVVAQLLSCVLLPVTPRTAARQASLSFTVSWSLLRFMSIKSVMPSNRLILCHLLLLLPSIFPTIRAFSNESALRFRWPKFRSFSFSICPSNEYSGLISFRIGWIWSPCCPRAFQESSLALQFKDISSPALSLLMVQLSHPYMTTRKTIGLTIWKSCHFLISSTF